ncbi:unnamed protein product [Dibothriocephalus latus]|uniref:Importin N-terminal domain-containing protein n=1 Tax=Dibothriocephalus latus TaxID=60516 RepID=A0A3P7LBY0_DIBLA|nr:unnamed protein product [Dibothriocephalus latus]
MGGEQSRCWTSFLCSNLLDAHVTPGEVVIIVLSSRDCDFEGIHKPVLLDFHLHDRRVCVLGLCTLLSLRDEERPPAVNKLSTQYLPALLLLLNGLKDAYVLKAQEENEGDSMIDEAEASDSDEDDDDDFDADSVLEEFDTDLDKDECKMDEYVTFYQLMTDMEQTHPGWYQQLVAPLSEAQKTEFKNIAETALKCIQQKQSKEIEKAGGYSFQQTDVPDSFDFSGNPPPGV